MCRRPVSASIGDGDAHAVATASTELGVGVDDELTLGRDAQIPA